MATTREFVGELLASSPYPDFRWMPGWDVIVRQWVRFKCMFGCPSYGKKGGCPPKVPSIETCREFFREYADMAVIHIVAQLEDPEARGAWSRQVNLELFTTFCWWIDLYNLTVSAVGGSDRANTPGVVLERKPDADGVWQWWRRGA